jgi:hypothetical protein
MEKYSVGGGRIKGEDGMKVSGDEAVKEIMKSKSFSTLEDRMDV